MFLNFPKNEKNKTEKKNARHTIFPLRALYVVHNNKVPFQWCLLAYGASVIANKPPVWLLSWDWCIIVYPKTEIPIIRPHPPLPHSLVTYTQVHRFRDTTRDWTYTPRTVVCSDFTGNTLYTYTSSTVSLYWTPLSPNLLQIRKQGWSLRKNLTVSLLTLPRFCGWREVEKHWKFQECS